MACTGGDQTLHISTNLSDQGALYAETGTNATGTNRRAESGLINTTGFSNLVLSFDMIAFAGSANDSAKLQYSDNGGTSWNTLMPQLGSQCCDGSGNPITCTGAEQGRWETYTVNLPASCDNNPNVMVGFVWVNTDDVLGSYLSIAVNNMQIVEPLPVDPVASFIPSQTTLCVDSCLTFMDNSISVDAGGITAWNWTFNGGSIANSNMQDPGSVCWNTAGTYNITLQVTDAIGTDDTTIAITVVACDTPTASFTASQLTICADSCITFTDMSSGVGLTGWDWTFNGGTPSIFNGQNPGTVCYDTPGVYDATLTVTNANGTDDTTISITVLACNVPTAGFSNLPLNCLEQCTDFQDLSTGNPTSWEWTFGGGTPASSTDQNPQNICFNQVGTFDITLIVSNAAGSDTMVTTVTINPLPNISAGPDVTIDFGSSVGLNAIATPGIISWSPTIGLSCTNCAATVANPINTTTYTVSVSDANGCLNSDDVTVFVKIVDGIGVPNAFSPNNDGLNDVLYLLGQGIEKFRLIIYNRYGQVVFETTDQSIGWDGTFNGKTMNPGVFGYTLEYNFFGKETVVEKGNISLIK